jgi:hypothetical protein
MATGPGCILVTMDERQSHDETDGSEGLRQHAWELSQAGWSQTAIATALEVAPGDVGRWLERARQDKVAPKAKRQAPGAVPRLSPEQLARMPGLPARGPGAGRSAADTTAGKICPHLGCCQDQDSFYSFPADGNCCHTEERPAPIDLSHQETVCLAQGWSACPRYQAAKNQASQEAPSAAAGGRRLRLVAQSPWILGMALTLVGMLLAVALQAL